MAGAQLSETCTVSFRTNSVIARSNSCRDIMSELVLCVYCPLQVGTLRQAYPPSRKTYRVLSAIKIQKPTQQEEEEEEEKL